MNKNNKVIATKLLETIGGNPKVIEYYDKNNISKTEIFISENRPYEGITSYGTIGLHNYDIDLVLPDNKKLRVEFVGACDSQYEKFPNMLSSCAFNIINSNYSCNPGTVYPNIVKEYYWNFSMEHIMLVSPFLWENLSGIELDNKFVTWLMLLPISEKEFQFLKDNGSNALEDLFTKNQIDVYNIERKSIL